MPGRNCFKKGNRRATSPGFSGMLTTCKSVVRHEFEQVSSCWLVAGLCSFPGATPLKQVIKTWPHKVRLWFSVI